MFSSMKLMFSSHVFPIRITRQPEDVSVESGGLVSFSCEAEVSGGGGVPDSYDWEVWRGESWSAWSEYSLGSTIAFLASPEMDGWRYRCVVRLGEYSLTSDEATLEVLAVAEPYGLLFDRSSWADVVPSPYLGHMDRAADRWGAFVRYDPAVVSLVQSQMSWSGLRLHSAADYMEAGVGRTYTVTVADSGSGNRYLIDGLESRKVALLEGETYTFDLSHPSNANHPLRFSTVQDGIHGGGSQYVSGVTVMGTPGNAGSHVRIVVAAGAPDLYYYCQNHSGMGGAGQALVLSPNTIAACYVWHYADIGGLGANALSFGLIINKSYEDSYSSQDWENIITHELGHALGIGLFWSVGDGAAAPPSDNFLDGGVYSGCLSGYNPLVGGGRVKIPLESTGSSGTQSAHWEDDFRPSSAAGSGGVSHPGLVNEMMVGYYVAGLDSTISGVSLGVLSDFGYEVVPGVGEGSPRVDSGMGLRKMDNAVRMRCGCGMGPVRIIKI